MGEFPGFRYRDSPRLRCRYARNDRRFYGGTGVDGGLFGAVVGDAVVEGGPGEERAFDADGELSDALEGFHVADFVDFVVGEFFATE